MRRILYICVLCGCVGGESPTDVPVREVVTVLVPDTVVVVVENPTR